LNKRALALQHAFTQAIFSIPPFDILADYETYIIDIQILE